MNNSDLSKWESIIYIWFIFHWLAMSHSCYNPVIYCYMNARFRIGFLQVLYFIPGIRRCCCINAYARARSTSLRTGIALTGEWMCNFLISGNSLRLLPIKFSSIMLSRPCAGIDDSAHLHRVNTSTTFISTRRKANIWQECTNNCDHRRAV